MAIEVFVADEQTDKPVDTMRWVRLATDVLQAEGVRDDCELSMLFVDVASGDSTAQPVVQPGQVFVDQLLPYFDQYALSHDLWAPDSSSILLPTVDAAGAPKVALMPRDGSQPVGDACPGRPVRG